MAKRTCSIEGCDGLTGVPGTARGWCSKHYNRWQRWGDPLGERPLTNKGQHCSIDGCEQAARSMGWCGTHYSRYHRKGDPLHRLAGEVVDGRRICPGCGEDKARTPEFWYPAQSRADGLAAECKECVKRRRRAVPRTPTRPVLVQCRWCLRMFETTNPVQRKFCSEACSLEGKREWDRTYDPGPEARRLANQRWRERHPERNLRNSQRYRARKANAFIEDVDPLVVFARDAWMCQLCSEPIDRTARWPDPFSPSVDHVIPLAKGGFHSYDNCQASHLRCNCIKGDRLSD